MGGKKGQSMIQCVNREDVLNTYCELTCGDGYSPDKCWIRNGPCDKHKKMAALPTTNLDDLVSDKVDGMGLAEKARRYEEICKIFRKEDTDA